jgi:hypothetical protein
MKSFSDFSTSATGNILLLGDPGTGKTTLCTQLKRPYFLQCDGNFKGPLFAIRESGLKLDFKYDMPHIDDAGVVVPRKERLRNFAKLLNIAMADPTIDTIIIDSLTTWQRMIEDEVRVQQNRAIADGIKVFHDEPLAKQDWRPFAGIAMEIIMKLKAWAQAMNKLSVFIGHIDTRTDESKEKPKDDNATPHLKYINFPGMLRQSMGGLFDDVWIIETDRKLVNGKLATVRQLKTGPDDFRDKPLGLKTSIKTGHRFDLDFIKLNALLS